jgi:putative heme-binding domain-containing protein
VQALAAEAIKSGDPAAGERVFRSQLTNCFACHSIGGAGGRVGPDLAPVGTALPIDLVVESVLWPQRQIKEGYTATMVQTRDGEVVQGYRVSEDKTEYVLREPATGKSIHIPAANIKMKRDVGSLMPDGLSDGLTRKELVDLVRFLSELGKPGPWRVSPAPLVRVWETLPAAGGPLAQRPPSTDPSLWTSHFSLTNGELPLSEIAPVGTAMWARFTVEVVKEGRFTLKLNDASGLNLRADGQGIPAHEPLDLSLAVGRHTIAIGINPAARRTSALACEIVPAPGSSGELRLPGN